MNRLAGIVGCLLAVAACVGAGILYWELQSAQTELRLSREATESLRLELRDFAARNETLTQQLAERPAETEAAPTAGLDVASMLKQMMAGGEGDGDGSMTPPENPFLKGFSQIFGEAEGEDAQDPTRAMLSGMAELMASEAGQNFMGSIIDVQMDAQYRDLYERLKLSPEKEAKMRAIYRKHTESAIQSGMSLFSGDGNLDELAASQKDSEAALKAELAEVLDARQLAEVEAYETELPVRAMRTMYEQQMGFMAPGLDAASRELAATVIAEESAPADPNAPPDFANLAEEQRAAFDRALARLEPQLDAEQHAAVARFLEQQADASEMSLGMFGSMFGQGEEAPEPGAQ